MHYKTRLECIKKYFDYLQNNDQENKSASLYSLQKIIVLLYFEKGNILVCKLYLSFN